MKKTLFALMLAMTASAAAFAQTATVTMKFTGLAEGDTVGVNLIDGKQHNPTNQAALHGGQAVVSLDIPQGNDGRAYNIYVKGGHTGEMIVLKAGENATVSGSVAMLNGYPRISGLKVTGSPTNDDYNARKLDREALNVIYEDYHKNPANIAYGEAYQKKDTAEMKRIRQSEGWKKFEADEAHFFQMVDSTFKAVHKANKDTWFGPLMMLTDYSYLTGDQKPEYDQLSDEAKNSFYGKIVMMEVAPPSMVGEVMPDFAFTDYNTKQKTSLKAVLAKSKYVLVDFWASWCRPCRQEIPNVKANYAKYHAKGFDVVSISADSKEADWLKALAQEKMPWPQDIDGKKGIANMYNVRYYPTTYLLDAEGRVVVKDIRGEELGKKLAELLGE